MQPSGYYLTVETRKPVPREAYPTVAGSMVTAMHTLLGDRERLCILLKAQITDPRVEVEVTPYTVAEDATQVSVVLHAVVQAVPVEGTLCFDKAKLSTWLKQELDFPVNVSKRSVPVEVYD